MNDARKSDAVSDAVSKPKRDRPMPTLPVDVVAYRRTPTFTEQSTPAGLCRDHQTKSGVWGRITVLSGTLDYVITEPGYEAVHRLDQTRPGIVVPRQKHHVEPRGEVRFFVEFHRARTKNNAVPP